MAFRYRVVVMLYVLVMLPAWLLGAAAHNTTPGGGFNWDVFWAVDLMVGTGLSALWLLVCWVATGGRAVNQP